MREDQGDIGRQGWQATHDLTYFTAAETALVDVALTIRTVGLDGHIAFTCNPSVRALR